jgi:flagellum-specific peptidoglycan hydrolase FlgJ
VKGGISVQSTRKPRWQQATALISLSTAGAMTGLAFTHGSASDLTSPSSVPVKLLAATAKASPAATGDAALRASIVKSAHYYLRLAQTQTPAQIEALIWQNDSLDGADHGESCAAFASLTLEAGAQAVGQQSWVTGGSTYPWALHQWADARVDPNPASLNITSVLQDAQSHGRWHPIGDGYTPQPGDWVLFDQHVEVVTSYSHGVLDTIGGDSLPNFSVNAHQIDGSLAAAGVAGFVNNGDLDSAASQAPASTGANRSAPAAATGGGATTTSPEQVSEVKGQASVPGLVTPSLSLGSSGQAAGAQAQSRPGASPAKGASAAAGTTAAGAASIPGAQAVTADVTSYSSAPLKSSASPSARYSRSQAATPAAAVSDSSTQQAFINAVAPGALAAQRQYGIPAAVTIAQAIDESGWGQSLLATQDHNLFGIKGTGPAGSVLQPTEEFINGESVTIAAPFRVYSNMAQSVLDHSVLLATGSSYKQAMADRRSPDAFANDLTGVYATDPNYGASLISLMRQYNLYRFDASTSHASSPTATPQGTTAKGSSGQAGTAQSTPTDSTPAQNTPAQNTPAQNTPAQNTPAQNTPAQNTPAQKTPALGAAIPGVAEAGGTALGTEAIPAAGQASVAGQAAGSGSVPSAAGASSSKQARTATPTRSAAGKARTATAGRSAPGRAGTATTGGSSSGRANPKGGAGRSGSGSGSGSASIPGVLDAYAGTSAATSLTTSAHVTPVGGQALRAGPSNVRVSTRRYVPEVPRIVTTDFIASAKTPLLRAKPIYQDVAANHGIRWELLAACDWMQCQAKPGVSPVYGETLGSKNPDGTVYRSKSGALDQVAGDLLELAVAVYGIDLRQRLILSVRELANVFAAFRWGGLLRTHRISAMEFPYSVEGLTAHHLKMRWPDIPEGAPDKPGTRFRRPFGAVPVVLGLGYPATA